MFLAALVLLSSPGVETNIVNQANPSTSIYCPLFVTRGEAVFGGPDVKPRGHNKTLQRHMCFSYIVRPLQALCVQQGYDQVKCAARSVKWIKNKN